MFCLEYHSLFWRYPNLFGAVHKSFWVAHFFLSGDTSLCEGFFVALLDPVVSLCKCVAGVRGPATIQQRAGARVGTLMKLYATI